MKISRLFKLIICAALTFPMIGMLFFIGDPKAASLQVGLVDLESGTLNVRSGPGVQYKRIGALKNGATVTVYYQTKNGWSEIRYNKKKSYVSSQYLRVHLQMKPFVAKGITDKVIKAQRKTWEKNYTKKQIYSMMSPHYTTSYIEKYFKQQMRTAGKDKNGNQLFHVIETEIWGYSLDTIDWNPEYQPKKPTIKYYKKNGKEYLEVSQFMVDELSGNHTSTLYLLKESTKANWKVYKYERNFND
ncbi:SH3 domain-containing protein [Heyndrickxia oleronia]|uniref:SH3 domain-containing protein n=1 Tax=Heyndrickxia oleronia TaxID=38875 RepID=UPI00203E1CF5|nr:SH3 domain-containing protein [Heyndrickxia oleronia]MCM3238468.1 SH3 domain-containing protein [Heyndrickxia oleronia]